MIINQKINIKFTDKSSINILEQSSSLCNKLYNMLLEECINDYKNNNEKKLLHNRNLRNYVVCIKKDYPFFYKVHSSPLKNVAFRLKEAYEHFFDGSGYPKFRSNRVKWFSLLYDEPNKGVKITGNKIKISSGYELSENNKKNRLYSYGVLAENIKDGIIKTYRITKEKEKYYLIVTLELPDVEKTSNERFISIDPNHKNFFVGIDCYGKSVEFENLFQIKYFDKEIDKVKSKRDKCVKKSIECINEYGTKYYKPSLRWSKLNKALNNLYHKRESQIKDALYKISHQLCDNYDVIAFGDYTPTIKNSPEKNMHRSMLNQTQIGKFRQILKHVCEKRGKKFILVNETNTTKECFNCGDLKHKEPEVRVYTCQCCGKTYYRDINSAINIGKKVNLLPSSGYIDLDLSKPMYRVRYELKKQSVVLRENLTIA